MTCYTHWSAMPSASDNHSFEAHDIIHPFSFECSDDDANIETIDWAYRTFDYIKTTPYSKCNRGMIVWYEYRYPTAIINAALCTELSTEFTIALDKI